MYSTPKYHSDNVQYFELIFYLLLVHKEDLFPRLTSNLPESAATCHPLSPSLPLIEAVESSLNIQVRENRSKMGFGSLSSPSAASQIVVDKEKVEKQMQRVSTHLEEMTRKALHHMRKDELWKRMLYGTKSPDGRTVSSHGVLADYGLT